MLSLAPASLNSISPMRYSKLLIPTLREDPAEAETPSHRLMLRAGMIRRVAAGIYDFLPLGLRTLRRVERIIREEMNRAGAQEVMLPFVQPAELWQETNRWRAYGKELLRLRDRHDREFCLAPTHEEVITDLVRREVRSYRDLPLILYQIGSKFRDEIRPRFGLMRGREFLMKDAYSFDRDEAGAGESYRVMYRAYERIFGRCGLRFRAVEADTGLIGGMSSHEFVVLADTGEVAVAACGSCAYAANVEQAEALAPARPGSGVPSPPREKVRTPGRHTVREVAEFLKAPVERVVKTMIYRTAGAAERGRTAGAAERGRTAGAAERGRTAGAAERGRTAGAAERGRTGDQVVAVLIRGDHELNEVKLSKFLGVANLTLADGATIEQATGAPKGFSGPIGLAPTVRLLGDRALEGARDLVLGANETDAHWIHADIGRDVVVSQWADLRNVVSGDPCPRCSSGRLEITRGIEVGHVFMLGTKYSELMKAVFLDESGASRPFVMGCFGIGVGRTMAAAIEQNYDAKGIRWPAPLAPFDVEIVPLAMRNPELVAAAERLERELEERGIEVLLDDRDERAGVKFNDADLIGIPLQVVLGDRSLAEGKAEIKQRATGVTEKVALDQVITRTAALANR